MSKTVTEEPLTECVEMGSIRDEEFSIRTEMVRIYKGDTFRAG
jgi:hypothetical protein